MALEVISHAQVLVDGQLVLDSGHERSAQGAVRLSPGWHDFRVRYQDREGYSHIYLSWAPPGKELQIIPPQNLRPWPIPTP